MANNRMSLEEYKKEMGIEEKKEKNNISAEEFKNLMNNTQDKNIKNNQKEKSKANRGMNTEEKINNSIQKYLKEERAIIQKIPTPIKVLDIDSNSGEITKGFYEEKSTVDYIGNYQGIPLAFEAKETKVETRFDLSNVKFHQYHFLKKWNDMQGISFLILYFSYHNEFYLIPFKFLDKMIKRKKTGGRKSIKYKTIKKNCSQIKFSFKLDFLSVVDKIYF